MEYLELHGLVTQTQDEPIYHTILDHYWRGRRISSVVHAIKAIRYENPNYQFNSYDIGLRTDVRVDFNQIDLRNPHMMEIIDYLVRQSLAWNQRHFDLEYELWRCMDRASADKLVNFVGGSTGPYQIRIPLPCHPGSLIWRDGRYEFSMERR